MKGQRHTRKESISILVTSNTGRGTRQFQFSPFILHLGIWALILFCAIFCVLAWQFIANRQGQASLRKQLDSGKEQITQMEAEKERISAENAELAKENEQLRQEARQHEEAEAKAEAEPEPVKTPPDVYPYIGSGGMLVSTYSQEQPYISINTHTEGTIVAAGDGIIISISANETYPLIMEIGHADGYVTRYLCHEAVQTQLSEYTQVKAGETLFTITTDNTQFDYQIYFGNESIDPLSVIEAKG